LRLRRRIAEIDEEKCDGCGLCVPSCHEGAIRIVDGKAKIIEELCDGIGDCIGECPKGAIKIVEEEIEVDFQWPVKLKLINPQTPFLKTSSLTLIADCAPIANPNLVKESLSIGAIAILCPKFDNLEEHKRKMEEILKRNEFEELRAIHMTVPCCRGILHIVENALKSSEKTPKLRVITVNPAGELS
jgi:Fe-S-cluster-containing hydrogenase component 2